MADTQSKDGGPAFPRTGDAVSAENRQFDLDGMSLRDYFAAKAMQSLISLDFDDMSPNAVSYDAYKYADAMLTAREP